MVKGSRWVGALVVGLLCQGCSFSFVDGPPARHEKLLYFDCTSTAGPGVVDTTIAVLTGTVALGAAEGDDSGGTGVALATAGLFAASAIYGIVKTQDCNKAKDALRIRLMKIFERDARLRAAEQLRVRTPDPPRVDTRDPRDLLEHPKRLPKRKKKRPVAPPPEEALPPAPPAPEGELPPAPPPPPAVTPAPATSAPPSSVLPPAPPAPPSAAPAPETAKSAAPAPPSAPPPAPAPVR